MRRLGPALVLLTLLVLLPSSAPAATGDLTFKDCLSRFAASPCQAVPGEVLQGGRDVAISPDGKYLFVADGQDEVVAFTRSAADGSVHYAGCIDGSALAGCTHLAKNVLQMPRSLAVSPDGSSLYVASETSDAIVRLNIGAGGALSFGECVEDKELPDFGCATEVASLNGPLRVVVSPDGKSVYASSMNATLSQFSTNLTLQNCYREEPIIGCGSQAEPLLLPYGLGFSPGGDYLYVTSVGRDAITWFKRAGDGSLSLAGCLADDDDTSEFSDSCSEESGVNYDWLNHIAISPNGKNAYVTDETTLGVLYHFSRNTTTGALSRQDCLADDLGVESPGCTVLSNSTGSGLGNVTDAVISPDEANVYAVGHSDSALNTFGLLSSPAGKLSFIRCLRANEVQGCSGFGESSTLSGPFGIAISPDGHDVYVANNDGLPALLHFEREAPGSRSGGVEEPGGEEPGTGGGGGGTGSNQPPAENPPKPQPITVKCNGLKATIVGTPGKDVLHGTKKKDVIAAGAGNDKVEALAGKDVVCGEGGNDKLLGGPDADVLLGGPGKDTLKGAGGADKMIGGPGADTLLGGPGRDSAKQ